MSKDVSKKENQNELSMEDLEKATGGARSQSSVKACTQCNTLYAFSYQKCPSCGSTKFQVVSMPSLIG